MKKKCCIKIKTVITSWELGDYFRQLSIVVAGIIVTFIGSDWVSNYYKQQEVSATMQLIKAELESNKEQLHYIREKIFIDQKIGEILLDNNYEYKKIPEDTLWKYISSVQSSYSFEYTSDALEVLKNSSLMQQVKDKKFLLSLIKTYDELRQIKEIIGKYYEFKDNALFNSDYDSFWENPQKAYGDDIYYKYQLALEDKKLRNFISLAPGFFSAEMFPYSFRLLESTLAALEEKYP